MAHKIFGERYVLDENGVAVSMKNWIGAGPRRFMFPGEIPRIMISGETLPEVWEKANLAAWFYGCEVPTAYDNPGDPPSKDLSISMVVFKPLKEPRIHKSFPAGLEDLEIYRQEVVEGIHDKWIDPSEGSTKWPYTYHDRLFNYNPKYPEPGPGINQIETMINDLVAVPHSRRVQAITWYPWFDPLRKDPPCMQRIWCRLLPDGNGILTLNTDFEMRSWDAFKASFMNWYAFTDLVRFIADEISKKLGQIINIGPIKGSGNSFHVYGKDFRNPEIDTSFQGFLESLKKRPFNERIIRSDDQIVQECFEDARRKIRAESI